jgi:hypothetical protein
MPFLHSFGPNDIISNRMVTRPKFEFVLNNAQTYLNNGRFLGANVSTGSANLYEYNVDRDGTVQQLIRPFIVKGVDPYITIGAKVTGSAYNQLPPGHLITGSYPMTSSVSRNYFPNRIAPENMRGNPQQRREQLDVYAIARKELISLKNTMNYYRYLSESYKFTGSLVDGKVNMIQIPSIFFSDGIQKGTVSLKYYFTGTLIGEASDKYQNGELISSIGTTSGSVVGLVLYNEGFMLMTSSVAISSNTEDFSGAGSPAAVTWLDFGNHTTYASSSLFSIGFAGTQKIPSMTMFATAQPGEVNNSQNPTWISSSDAGWKNNVTAGAGGYIEPDNIMIKNTVQSDYCNYEDEFQKQVFINQVGIFDEDKNLLGIARLANPVLKKETDNYTFKINLDM